MDAGKRAAWRLGEQGCIWLAVRHGIDYRFRRAAPKVEEEIHESSIDLQVDG
jgi:hypothetical protein